MSIIDIINNLKLLAVFIFAIMMGILLAKIITKRSSRKGQNPFDMDP